MKKDSFVVNIVIINKRGKIVTQGQVGQSFENLYKAKEILFGNGRVETIKHLMSDSARIKYRGEYFSVDKQEDMNMLTIVMDNKKKTYKKAVFTIVPVD